MDQQGDPAAGGKGISRLFTWMAVIALIAGLTAFYQVLTPDRGGLVDGTLSMVVLERNRAGHYLAPGKINGQPVRFLVDTGATDVAVSEDSARALGLDFGPRTTVMTAAGPSLAWKTRIAQIRVGQLGLENVRATIVPGLGEDALLGMSFLKHFDLRQQGDELLIERTVEDG
jgi:aspartyl protease family protein